MLIHWPAFCDSAQAQLAVTKIAPLPPVTGKPSELGERLKLQTAASCVTFTNGDVVFSVETVMVPVRVTPSGFGSTENVNEPLPVITWSLAAARCSHAPLV